MYLATCVFSCFADTIVGVAALYDFEALELVSCSNPTMAIYSCVLFLLFTNRIYETGFIPSIDDPMIAEFAALPLVRLYRVLYKGWYL